MYSRSLSLGHAKSLFLWGPRQTGKSSLLKKSFPKAPYIDLLQSDLWQEYSSRPSLLRERLASLKAGERVVIDEVQKVPALLDEVHWLIENKKLSFALCGSSARKLKRGNANLLGGRALRHELWGLTSKELGKDFDLVKALNRGGLPSIYGEEKLSRDFLRSYCADYLKEEIQSEGLVRNLPNFAHFLEIAALSDTEQVAFATIARDVGVSSTTIKSYFEILEDTLIGNFVEVYRKRPKRRLSLMPKFYFFDVGVVNSLVKRGMIVPGSELFGKAFENWVHHEINSFKSYHCPDLSISFWRLSSQIEVDFILNDMEVAIEVKASARIHADHIKGLEELKKDHPKVKRRIIVCLEKEKRILSSGIEVLPYADFFHELWSKEIITG
jgi:uncharacterized protein